MTGARENDMNDNIRYRNDNWTLEDKLGTGGAGDLLARLALEADPPFCARVIGKWGSGKTSVLRRAFATLGGKPVQQEAMQTKRRDD